MNRLYQVIVGLLLCCACQAGIALGATRVVLEEGRRDATLTVRNTGEAAFLTQSWVQRDEADTAQPATEIWISPPILRLAGGKEAVLRVMPLDVSALPKDRESLFYLNVQQVPQLDAAQEANQLVLAIRQRIKLLFRPRGLPGNPQQPLQAVRAQLRHEAGKSILIVQNSSAFHLSFASLLAKHEGQIALQQGPMLLVPFGELRLPLKLRASELQFSLIDDFGSRQEGITQLNEAF